MQPYNFLVSEKHRKYLVEIIVDDCHFYTVQSIDQNGVDKIFVDKSNKILLCRSIETLSGYIHNEYDDPGKDFLSWLNELQPPVKPYSEINFDTVLSLRNNEKEALGNAVAVLGVIEDYAYQTEDNEFLKALSDMGITSLRDYFMDRYIWKTTTFNDVEKIGAGWQRSFILISEYFRDRTEKI